MSSFISHSSRGWSPNHGTIQSGEGSLPDHRLSRCPHTVEGARELSGVSFIRAQVASMVTPLSWPNHLPTPSLLRVGISTYECRGDANLQTIAKLTGWWQDSIPWELSDSGPRFFLGCWPGASFHSLPGEHLLQCKNERRVTFFKMSERQKSKSFIPNVRMATLSLFLFSVLQWLGLAHTEGERITQGAWGTCHVPPTTRSKGRGWKTAPVEYCCLYHGVTWREEFRLGQEQKWGKRMKRDQNTGDSLSWEIKLKLALRNLS